ncbi:MAG: glycosyltransferase family 4 protein [Nocardiopsaceae bacterium]|nr:glycosyltransferase family 4 protein [Nocardiopsaceae bacterium]
MAGLRELGHRVIMLTAAGKNPHGDPDLIELPVTLPDPATEDDLLRALADPEPVTRTIREILTAHQAGIVCWADASWGLGYLAPAPARTRTVLKVAVVRDDDLMARALAAAPGRVITNSPFLISHAADAGLDVTGWAAVPNALLATATPPEPARREDLRRHGPVRIAVRAEPHKGIAELIAAIPPELDRTVEIALAAAGFEYWPGMQDEVLGTCRETARRAPCEVRILPPLSWRDVPGFLADAALTIISTTSPESWCNAAAEALSGGTPVIAYDAGHVPALAGPAGEMVPPGAPPDALWAAATRLLADPRAYHAASAAAPAQVRPHSPAASAAAFLSAVS